MSAKFPLEMELIDLEGSFIFARTASIKDITLNAVTNCIYQPNGLKIMRLIAFVLAKSSFVLIMRV